jgi:pantoate--beta-alanine ligase
VDELKHEGRSIGFVPTMGYLHRGHISLIEESKKRADVTIVSIFVNPTQFAPNEDFGTYPRDLDRDSSLLEASGTDYLFCPSTKDIYSENFQTYVDVCEITKIIEGEFRPTHFKGVTTIVSILFNCVKPNYAFLGQKDAQQAAVIKQMVDDLKYSIEVVICPIVREPDGLAMSSRNAYLSPDEREKALLLNKSLKQAEEIIIAGERNTAVIVKKINNNFIKERSIHLNYIRIVNVETFKEVDKVESGKEYYCLIAAKVGSTRLIDNILIQIN